MAGYQQLGREMQRTARATATHKPVIDEALSKAALGYDFKAQSITVNQPLAEPDGDTIIRHAPPDGTIKSLKQESSDGSLRIVDETSGNIGAYFYSNGRTYIDLTNSALENRHYSTASITGAKLADDTVTGGKIANSTILSGNIDDGQVNNRVLGTDSVSRGKVQDTEITYAKLNGDTKGLGTGTSSMRSIGSGSSTSAAGSNHTHLSVNFNSQYTIAQKEAAANLISTVRDMVMQPALAPLRDLVLELAHQLMDEPDHTVQEKVNRLKTDPVYTLEFRMKHDPEYYAAWCIDNVPEYAAKMADDPVVQGMAAHARQVYTRIEDDPVIVEDYLRRKGPFS